MKRFGLWGSIGVICFQLIIGIDALAAELDKGRVERGRYLIVISGCNDCHTPGWLMTEGEVPESQWLIGDTFGWRGPWGTTYPKNLRLLMQGLEERQWIEFVRRMRPRPPMPWFNLNKMVDDDLAAIYHYVRSLGAAGTRSPDALPPEQEPPQPYALFPSPPTE